MKIKAWHRRQAVMLASQLPEKTEDALLVLRLATQHVTDFVAVEPEMKSASVIALIEGNNCWALKIPKREQTSEPMPRFHIF
ncbi:hypothetical protein [Bradyrhizobium sp. JR3.5]